MTRLTRRIAIMVVALLLGVVGIVAATDDDDSTATPPSATATIALQSNTVTASATTSRVSTVVAASTASATAPGTQQVPDATATSTPVAQPTPTVLVQIAPPVRLRIPTLGIDAAVQWVGVDDQGRMGVPSNYTDVAWFEPGPTPGSPGNAVIDGHLDSQTGPAVFYRLEELQPGDEVFTATESGTEYRFVVVSSEIYDAHDAPLDRVFGKSDGTHLNLITCDGAFDHSIREYDKRLVVFTELATGP